MTHLKIEQNNTVIELVNNAVIRELYQLALSNNLDNSSNLVGRLHVTGTYLEYIDEIRAKYPDLYITCDKVYLYMGDPHFTQIIADRFGDGYGCVLSDIQAVNSLLENAFGGFNNDLEIIDATGLKYFTGLDFNRSNVNYWYGFLNCTNLQRAELPEGLINLLSGLTLGNLGTFKGCTSLSYVKIPSTVLTIGASCFYNCASLTSIDLPASVTKLLGSSFNGSGLTSIQLPIGLLQIGNLAFANTLLQSIYIPSSVVTMGYDLFQNTPIASIIFDLSDGEDLSWTSGSTYGEGIITMTTYANTSLTTLDFPARLTSIGLHGFRGLSALTTLIFRGTTPPTIDRNDFGFANTPTIYVPDSAVSTYLSTSPFSNYTIHAISELSQ